MMREPESEEMMVETYNSALFRYRSYRYYILTYKLCVLARSMAVQSEREREGGSERN